MKKNIRNAGFLFVFGALMTLVLFGTGYADDELWREAPTYPGASAYTYDEAGAATISGIVNPYNTFVDDRGRTLNLANSDEGRKIQSLVGERVEIKGTVMDAGGQQTVDVSNYKIIEDNINDGDRY